MTKQHPQTITVELTREQMSAIEDAYFDEALPECTMMTEQQGKHLYLCFSHTNHDEKPVLKINLDKEIRGLASDNAMATNYEELVAMVKSFGRTYDFLKQYLKTWETE